MVSSQLSGISYDAFEATVPITEFGKGGVAAVYK